MGSGELYEKRRLDALRTYRILDTSREDIFDGIVRLAARICDTPIAVVTFVDEHRQWFKASVGLEVPETARSISFCTHAIQSRSPLVVPDASLDERFNRSPLVTGPPHIAFYTGIPLIDKDGYSLGTLAVIDRVPRELDERQTLALETLASQVVSALEIRRQHLELEQLSRQLDETNRELVRKTRHLNEAQRIAGLGSWEWDSLGDRLTLSDEVYRIFGVEQTLQPKSMASFLQSVHRDDRPRVQEALDSLIAGKAPLCIEHRIVLPGKDIRYVSVKGELSVNDEGRKTVSGTVLDITTEQQYREQLQLIHAGVSRIKDVIMVTEAAPVDEPGPRIVFINNAFEEMTGYSAEETLGKSPRFLQGKRTSRSELQKIRNALVRQKPVSAELVNYTKDGREFVLEIDLAPIQDAAGRTTHFVSVQRDVTLRKEHERVVERLAFYDSLTGLPNRTLLLDRLQHAQIIGRRSARHGALLFIDLDNFKSLNDTLGHATGDMLLRAVAARLASGQRKSNTVARFGGDEFVVLVENLSPVEHVAATQAEHIAEKIRSAFNMPFPLDKSEYQCSASIGIALFNGDGEDVDELLRRADIAMYHSKSSGRNMICFFDPDMQKAVNARVKLEKELLKALHQGEFVLYCQPQTDITGRIIGLEALVRWSNGELGVIGPDHFIDLAEETGLIVRLGQWVMKSACLLLAGQRNLTKADPVSLSVNISAREFRHPGFVEKLLKVVEETGADPRLLKLELTESVLLDNMDETIGKMQRLKERGISFSLDDFGTGYSSLAYLKRLPLDQIKIDRSFVKDVVHNPNDAAIVRTIVALGNILGLDVIAEGVETEEQRDALADWGCHAYQGYLFSRPMPAEQLLM